jgi:hypothetical protein
VSYRRFFLAISKTKAATITPTAIGVAIITGLNGFGCEDSCVESGDAVVSGAVGESCWSELESEFGCEGLGVGEGEINGEC